MHSGDSLRVDILMRIRLVLLFALFVLLSAPALAALTPAGHNVTFLNTCNQPVWINLQGGPKGECDHDFNRDSGRVNCSACSVCPSGSLCNTSKATGDSLPLCCPGIRTDLLYCWNKANQCVRGGCCPGIPQTAGTAYNCPGTNETTGCQNTTMNQSRIDALSGYNNPDNHLSRIVCNGSLISNGGFRLDASTGNRTFLFENGWQGAFYPRTNCALSGGNFHCETGNCKDAANTDVLECGGAGSAAPVTKAEINFDSPVDWYDVSWVDGFNVAMVIQPMNYDAGYIGSDAAHKCAVAGCSVGLNDFRSPDVPNWSILKYPSVSRFSAILSDCNLYSNLLDSGALPRNETTNKTLAGYCCPISEGYVNDSSIAGQCVDVPAGKTCKTCAGQNNNLFPFNKSGALPNSAKLFYSTCPTAYAYTYNDTDALMTCRGSSGSPTSYRITLSCPVHAPVPTLTQAPASLLFSESPGEEPGSAALISPPSSGGAPLDFIFSDFSRSDGSSTISDTTVHHIHVNTTGTNGETILRLTKNTGAGAAPELTGRAFVIYYRIESPHLQPSHVGSAVIEFSVREKHLASFDLKPEDIVLLRWDGTRWQELPTVFDFSSKGRAYYTAITPGFSIFAISSRETLPVSPTGTTLPPAVLPAMNNNDIVTPAPATSDILPVPTPAALRESPAAPMNQSLVPPPADSPGLPVLAALITGIGCCVFGGGWYIRRWWIRRQNPALFEGMD